jgi:hypothetical protein
VQEEIDENVRQLIDVIGCSPLQGKLLLDSTLGDIEEAKRIVDSLNNKNLFVLKGRFEGKGSGMYGLLYFVFNTQERIAEKVSAVVTRNRWLSMYDVEMSWDIFERNIQGILERKTGVALKSTKKLVECLEEMGEEFLQYLDSLEDLRQKLCEVIGEVIGDPQTQLHLAAHQMSSFLMEEGDTGGGNGKIVLSITPVVSPVSGVSVSELKQGDRILVKVTDQTELGSYFAQLMGGRLEEKIFPVIAPIEEISVLDSDRRKIVVNFGRAVVGEMRVSEELKISTPEKKKSEPTESEPRKRIPIPIKVPQKVRELQQSKKFPFVSIFIIFGIFLFFVLFLL